MAVSPAEVSIGQTGAFSKVALGTVITSPVSDLGPDVVDYGLLSDSGIDIDNTTSRDTIKAWQNSAIVRTVNSDSSVTFKLVLIQNSVNARELYFGSPEVDGKISWNPANTTKGAFVIDFIDNGFGTDGEPLTGRYYIKNGEVTEVDTIGIKNGEPIGYGVTITAFPDETGTSVEVFHSNGAPEEIPAGFAFVE